MNASGKAVGLKGRVPVAREKKDDTSPGMPISSHRFEDEVVTQTNRYGCWMAAKRGQATGMRHTHTQEPCGTAPIYGTGDTRYERGTYNKEIWFMPYGQARESMLGPMPVNVDNLIKMIGTKPEHPGPGTAQPLASPPRASQKN